MTVSTIRAEDAEIVRLIRAQFMLEGTGPLSQIDDNLLLLAFSPNMKALSRSTANYITTTYHVSSHQSLEFFGDRILYSLVARAIIETYGLRITPGHATQLTHFMTSNQNLTNFMQGRGSCELVRVRGTVDTATKHNPCVDSLEALIGALYYHLLSQATCTDIMYEWFLELFDINQLINKFDHEDIEYARDRLRNLARLEKWVYEDPVSLGWEGYRMQVKGKWYKQPTLLLTLQSALEEQ